MKKLILFISIGLAPYLIWAQLTYHPNSLGGVQMEGNEASGMYSTALGIGTTASGLSALSSGLETNASGYYSMAFGSGTYALNTHSFVQGYQNIAAGINSVAFGKNNYAYGHGTFVIGQFNISDPMADSENYSLLNQAFIIGNGISENERSNAFSVLFDGTTNVAGEITAQKFNGDGTGLTGLPINFNITSYNGIESPTNSALGTQSVALGKETQALKEYSTALGNLTIANGDDATAMGYASVANGNASLSVGFESQANGAASVSMGALNVASADASVALGFNTLANSYAGVAIGQFNSSNPTENPLAFESNNTAFVIGNGDSENARNNAFEIDFNGNITASGYVTATSFIGDGSAITGLAVQNNSTEITALEQRQNAGYENAASGAFAVALGVSNIASGEFSTAFGAGNNSVGSGGFVAGNESIAYGDWTTAVGYQNISAGAASTTFGFACEAYGVGSVALGDSNVVNANLAQAFGGYNTISADFSSAIGLNNTLLGEHSKAFGSGLVTNAAFSTAIGTYNTEQVQENQTQLVMDNTAFVIGNGSSTERSDAFRVQFNGNTTIAGDLTINSDARLKTNIISLGNTLANLLLIDGKRYSLKKDVTSKPKVGLLAQNILNVYPELVSETNGILSVNYQGLVPVVINAIKEQQELIKTQDQLLEAHKQQINTLEKELLNIKRMLQTAINE